VRAYRSPLRLFAFGVVGLVLLLAAVDVMFGHWISTPPENTDGFLSTRGQAQQRGDIVWGSAMIAVGTLLVGGAVLELVRRQPEVEVTPDGLVLAIGSREREVTIGWSNIDDVSSAVLEDPYDGSSRANLVVDVVDRTGLPDDPLGATWRGDDLCVDASGWTKPVTDVALAAQAALGHHRRMQEITQMGPPSLEWFTTVNESASAPSVPSESDPDPDAGGATAGVPAAPSSRAATTVAEPAHPDDPTAMDSGRPDLHRDEAAPMSDHPDAEAAADDAVEGDLA
jgi:hypothetical protein